MCACVHNAMWLNVFKCLSALHNIPVVGFLHGHLFGTKPNLILFLNQTCFGISCKSFFTLRLCSVYAIVLKFLFVLTLLQCVSKINNCLYRYRHNDEPFSIGYCQYIDKRRQWVYDNYTWINISFPMLMMCPPTTWDDRCLFLSTFFAFYLVFLLTNGVQAHINRLKIFQVFELIQAKVKVKIVCSIFLFTQKTCSMKRCVVVLLVVLVAQYFSRSKSRMT